jgi:putative phosphoesterase
VPALGAPVRWRGRSTGRAEAGAPGRRGWEAKVRIGLVSDVHCNVAGLTAALEGLGTVDLLLCAGDMVLQYRFSDDVVALLQERESLAIQGNHEKILLSPHGDGVRRAGQGTADNWAWLAAQPGQRRLAVDGYRLLLAHGAPWDEPTSHRCEYLYPHDTVGLRRLRDFDADVIVLGHTHYPMLQRIAGTLAVNPGSCGEARDRGLLTYGLLDTTAGTATLYRLDAGHVGETLCCEPLPTPGGGG